MRSFRFATVLTCIFPLSACLGFGGLGGGGSNVTHVPHLAVDRPATVDPAAAAAMVSDFRKKSGLGAVTIDPTLAAIAARHAKAMAAADKLSHVLPGEVSFAARLSAGRYDAAYAAENVGAGYHDLNEAFAGWKASPPHRANMLNRNVDRIGIAVAYNKDSKFKDFWCLVLAKPDERKMAAGPSGGPAAQ
jgi:uncharacterized protein YkwD